jgi:beta-lactam-binding protein with PASTA domain
MLYVAGEHIPAGSAVVISLIDGKAYAVAKYVSGEYLGDAVEELREGFRIFERDGEVREDDA